MEAKKMCPVNKKLSKEYYQEIIVKPAGKLLRALTEAEEKEKQLPKEIRKVVTSHR